MEDQELFELLFSLKEPEFVRLFRSGEFFAFGPTAAYRLGAAPLFASYSLKPRGAWLPDAQAGERIMELFEISPAAKWATGHGSLWWERASGQGCFEWDTSDHHELARCRFAEHWREFQQVIPAGRRSLAKKFMTHRLAVLRLLAACPEATFLAVENPCLFAALAAGYDAWSAAGISRVKVSKLVRGPQVAILEDLGLPATESVRRFLRKVPAALASAAVARGLAHALQNPNLRRALPHFPKLDLQTVSLLSEDSNWPYLSAGILGELTNRKASAVVFGDDPAKELLRKLEVIKGRKVEAPPGGFKSLAALNASADEIDPRPDLHPWAKFPTSPFSGTDSIVPLRSVAELMEEGRQMRNCVGDRWMAACAMQGRSIFFKVLSPQRATLQIVRDSFEGPWIIEDIRTIDNDIPQFATIRSIVDALGVPAAPVWHPRKAHWFTTPYPFMPARTAASV